MRHAGRWSWFGWSAAATCFVRPRTGVLHRVAVGLDSAAAAMLVGPPWCGGFAHCPPRPAIGRRSQRGRLGLGGWWEVRRRSLGYWFGLPLPRLSLREDGDRSFPFGRCMRPRCCSRNRGEVGVCGWVSWCRLILNRALCNNTVFFDISYNNLKQILFFNCSLKSQTYFFARNRLCKIGAVQPTNWLLEIREWFSWRAHANTYGIF